MKPILFNTEMVQAIQEGRKVVTRRVIKYSCPPKPESALDDFIGSGDPQLLVGCAPYHPGDILWVRETWQFIPCIDCRAYAHDGCVESPVTYEDKDSVGEGCFIYRATYPEPERACWHPSIHMPKEAARLFLRVTGVRVERLQDITPEQIDAEGCKEYRYSVKTGELIPSSPIFFEITWDSTIKPSDLPRYGWEANPWVFVIEFEQIGKAAALGGS